MQAAATIALAAAHTSLVELSLLHQRLQVDTARDLAHLAIVRLTPAATWAAVNGDPAQAINIDAFASGRRQVEPPLPPTTRTVPQCAEATDVQRAIGLLDAVCTELGNSMSVLGHGCGVDLLARVAETMISPVVSTVNGASAVHRVEYCLLAAGASNTLPTAWVEDELLGWGRTHADVLADFGLARLVGWLRTGRLVTAGICSDLRGDEINRVRAAAGDLQERHVNWFGSDIESIRQFGLLDGLDRPALDAFAALMRDGWEGSVGSLARLAQAL